MARDRLAADPEDIEALLTLARVATAAGYDSDAEKLLKQATRIAPAYALAHVDLTSLLCRLGRADEAMALIDHVIGSRSRPLWALSLKCSILTAERRVENALPIHEELVERAPEAAVPWLNYGDALKIVGRVEEAAAAYRKSLELDPASGFAWIGLANLRKIRLDDQDIARLDCALHGATDDLQRIHLHFTLGKALGERRQYEHSFRHYQSAKEIRHRLIPYDAEAIDNLVRKTEALFTAAFLAKRSSAASGGSDAIFIIGMPRSGSSLLEQILASHPMVEGLGELFDLQNIVARVVRKGRPNASWLEIVGNLSADELHALGESYMSSVRQRKKSERPFFTDKMPSNWRYVGLIHLILPKARIIDIRRHPAPCCFSNFTTYFNAQTIVPNTLDDLSHNYLSYVRMLSHFDAAMPSTIHRVYFERLVNDFESEVRRLLEYLNLPFDQACLRFHENLRPVYTPSAEQVRRPINDEGIGLWKNYETWLSPLQDKLGSTWELYPGRLP
ncbi:sulfotransferase family protein [Mesorhizobium sp. A623]